MTLTSSEFHRSKPSIRSMRSLHMQQKIQRSLPRQQQRGNTVLFTITKLHVQFSVWYASLKNTGKTPKPATFYIKTKSNLKSRLESSDAAPHPVRHQLRRVRADWVLGRWSGQQGACQWLGRQDAGLFLLDGDTLVGGCSWPGAG